MVKAAFPMSSSKGTKLFMKIKSKDAEKLDLAIEEFISSVIMHAADHESLSSLRDDIMKTTIQVGHVGSNTILITQLDSSEVGSHVDS